MDQRLIDKTKKQKISRIPFIGGLMKRMKTVDTNDIFLQNEQQGNQMVALSLLVMLGVFVTVYVFNVLGIFAGRRLGIAAISAIILNVLLLIVYAAFGPCVGWMKHFLLGGMVFAFAIIDSQLTYKVDMIMVVPIVISIRFFSKETTLRVALLTIVVFTLSAIYGATNGILDLNIIDIPQKITLYIENRLVTTLEERGLDDSMLIRNTLLLNYLPNLMIYLVVAYGAVKIAVRGHEMILEEKHLSRVESELSMAHDIQQHNLPNLSSAFPDRKEFDIYATMTPSREIGGDYYDCFMVDEDHLCVVIADVSDKGVPAALFMMYSKSLIKAEALRGDSPKALLEAVNKMLCDNNEELMFVTVWLGILEISTGTMTCVNAGHEYPIIKSPLGAFDLFRDKHGMFIGVSNKAKYNEYELKLEPGSKLFLYTDGLTEAVNDKEEQFGVDRIVDVLNRNKDRRPSQLLDAVQETVDGFVNEAAQFDDLTMLCLEYRGMHAE